MHNTVVLDQKRRRFIGGSDARIIMGDDEGGLLQLWRDMGREVEREGLPLGVATKDPGRMPIGWHVVAICYATAAILLGWWPWNFLLLLLLFPIRNTRVRHGRTERINAVDLIAGRGSST